MESTYGPLAPVLRRRLRQGGGLPVRVSRRNRPALHLLVPGPQPVLERTQLVSTPRQQREVARRAGWIDLRDLGHSSHR